jgi:uncharacterized membrane protein
MVGDLLARSPVLMGPLVAMFVFMVVFVGIVIRAITRSQAEVDRASRMPLDGREAEEVVDEHR